MAEYSESNRIHPDADSPIASGRSAVRHRVLFSSTVGLLALALVALPAPPAFGFPIPEGQGERRFEFEVRELFFAGLRGDEEALDQAFERCEEALAADPENWEALVWRGSVKVALSGRAYQTGDFANGTRLWDEGLEEMRRATEAAPDRIEVLIPEAATLLETAGYHPFPAERERLYGVAYDNYVRVFEIQSAYFDRMSEHARGELLMSLANVHLRVGRWDAVEPYLRRAIDTLPGTTYAAEAERLLAETEPASVKTCHGCHQPEDE